NLKQLALACNVYAEVNKAFPPGGVGFNTLSWRCYILPYIEEKNIFNEMVAKNAFLMGATSGDADNEGISVPAGTLHRGNYFATQYRINTFLCPSHSDFVTTRKGGSNDKIRSICHYSGVMGQMPTTAGDPYPASVLPNPFPGSGTTYGG